MSAPTGPSIRSGGTLLILVMGLLAHSHNAVASATDSPEDGALRIQIARVDPVPGRVYFSVLTPNGTPHTALQREDFEFVVGGKPVQQVRLRSFVDDSLSRLMVVFGFASAHMTRAQSRNLVVAAGRHFLVEMSEEKPDRAAIMTFADEVYVPSHFSADPIRLKRDLRRLQFRGHTTRLFDGLIAGKQLIEKTDSAAFGALVFALDQRDTSSRADWMTLTHEIERGGFPPVFLIGLGGDSALAHDLDAVAAATGGASFMVAPRSNKLSRTYADILNRLEHQYVATLNVPMLSGGIEIVHRTKGGVRITARTELPEENPAPTRIPSYGPDRDPQDWRQTMLLLVLGGLLVSLGLLRMGAGTKGGHRSGDLDTEFGEGLRKTRGPDHS